MTYSKMPLKLSQKWPRQFGFEIIGEGPTFVLSVEKGSIAFKAGLLPGDQILELDGHDVTYLSVDTLKKIARHSHTQPPTLGVVSRLLHLEIVGSKTIGLGFNIEEGKPVTVRDVVNEGPAEQAGLRPGDIILEVNFRPIFDPDEVKLLLSSHSRGVMLSIIPAGRHVTKPITQVKGQAISNGSRVQRARDFHGKVNIINAKQQNERRLLKKPFIPPRQRSKFDDVIKQMQQKFTRVDSHKQSSVGSSPTHKVGQRRSVRVVRENNSFGFVVKGSNPAYIDTIDPGGPAEKAGLRGGDFIIKLNGIDVRKSSHSHLVHLLQDSGPSPILDIIRCEPGQEFPHGLDGPGITSSVSSNSSYTDYDWLNIDQRHLVDKEGHTLQNKAEYLLTRKERAHLGKAISNYNSSNNIVEFYDYVTQILDTPSKKSLWMFLLARMSPQHREYCTKTIGLPSHILMEVINLNSGKKLLNTPDWSKNVDESSTQSSYDSHLPKLPSRVQISSFQQQVEYLLTSRERLQLKKALQLYSENRNFDNLMEDLQVILDTPSKKSLWKYIIPLLSPQHQEVASQKVYGRTATLPITQRRSVESNISSDDDEHELFSKTGARKMKLKPGTGSVKPTADLALIRELEETRKVVKEAKELFSKRGNAKPDLEKGNVQAKKYITVIPITHNVKSNGHRTVDHDNTEVKEFLEHEGSLQQSDSSTHSTIRSHSEMVNTHFSPRDTPSKIYMRNGTINNLGLALHSSKNSESEVDKHNLASKFSLASGDSFNQNALVALKELDAAMAAEVSDMDNNEIGSGMDRKHSSKQTIKTPAKITTTNTPVTTPSQSAAPPPPPPPPPPVPPASLNATGGQKGDKAQMNVKRINWIKLDQDRVGSTIWEQIGETEDLMDVVRYLELEQHFSTAATRTKLLEKKNEVYILNPKKAYNISILLGHLKLSEGEVTHALYLMDEEVLTPELLKQLLSFAPSKEEMEKLDSYNGNIDDLSKPDRFTYQMTRVPGYEQRLKALVFKANFHEKIGEMRQNLLNIKKASLELRQSKKLAKILELILAMGNYMNKGNDRVGEAAGFRISFLSQLEVTKTSDQKSTFLHVLAEAVSKKFPEVLSVGEQLTTVPEAAKVSNIALNQELQELRKVLQDISDTLSKFGSQKRSIGIDDRFQDIMGHFISQASDEIQSLLRLQASTMQEFHNTVQYFGEDPKTISTIELFGVFSEFIIKFE
ncbi:hypothetical protein ACJMK2_033457, partial [Sinanodonta woodiana]